MRRSFKTYDKNGTGLLSVADFRKVRLSALVCYGPGAHSKHERPAAWDALQGPCACPLLAHYSVFSLKVSGNF